MKFISQDCSDIHLGIVGGIDFQRRMNSVLSSSSLAAKSFTASTSEAWAKVLSDRPNLIILEIGIQYSERTHQWTKNFLDQLRDRFGSEIVVAAALTAPEKFFYGGDLLFADESSLNPSEYLDTFLVQPPGGMPSLPNLAEQTTNVVELTAYEMERRSNSGIALPHLNTESWVQSLADPTSRELWMLWLPKYAGYTTENPIITGPTGTGKTKLAAALHTLSGRKGPFISITPRDFSSSELIQAELFGAVAGAYTGAVDKWGLVKSAEGGTLFIDELQSIDKDLQGKLITFIENKSYRRVGSAETIQADVRFCFATNRPIDELVEAETLRNDFAYRLERVELELPALTGRRLDISSALAYALAKIRRERPQSKPVLGVSSGAHRMLISHNWPGNLRQLENTAAKLCEVADMSGRAVIDDTVVSHVFDSKLLATPTTTPEVIAHAAHKVARDSIQYQIGSLEDGLEKFIEEARFSALESTGGDSRLAAELLLEDEHILDLFSSSREAKKEKVIEK